MIVLLLVGVVLFQRNYTTKRWGQSFYHVFPPPKFDWCWYLWKGWQDFSFHESDAILVKKLN